MAGDAGTEDEEALADRWFAGWGPGPGEEWLEIDRLPGDLLAPHALLVLAEYLHSNPQLHAVYTDEDIVEADGRRHSPRFKPDFDLEWLRGSAYIGSLLLARQSIWQASGGWRHIGGGQDEFEATINPAGLKRPPRV